MQLEGTNFKLRPWRMQDAPSLQRHADNPSVSKYLLNRFPYPYTLIDAEEFLQHITRQERLTTFAIEVDGEAAGGIGLELRRDVYRYSPLIGYWLSEEHWGRGIMVEAVKILTHYAFTKLDAICVQAFVFSENTRSMRVLEKAGYQKQGIIRQSVIKRGVVMDEHIYAAYPKEK
ncbi:GNAT family N-acetyltransferase [Mucilaginibacter achroorhodeus]|uniref:GNAT family N-acetyltransferase n=1 Tax=Mucilaginibacter achroorhodeus TaxID=2599294 RepID=A0A563UBF9_9SPHI|nr:GNAT family protein [Mucilaginibacter achroorhodeus]TWR28718.1 GNAT family N-acetyltransferase [Mucilaginibacter achroorhodeus]